MIGTTASDDGLSRYDAWPASDVELPSGRLRVIDVPAGHAPAGPPVVLVHGSPTSSVLWRHTIASLVAQGRRVVAPDQLGQGGSAAPDGGVDFVMQAGAIADLLTHLALDAFDLVVHDWGGPAGLAACVPRWERLRRLVLVNTTFLPDWAPPPGWEAFTDEGSGEDLLVGKNAWAEGLPTVMTACADNPALHARYLDPSRRVGSRRTFLRLERLEGLASILSPVAELLSHRPPPTRIVWGTPDVYFGDEHERLRAALPEAEVVLVPDGGHFPQEDRPEQTDAAISGFLL